MSLIANWRPSTPAELRTELWPALMVLITAVVMDRMGLCDGQGGLRMSFYRTLPRGQRRGPLRECIGLLGGGIKVFPDSPVTCECGSAIKGLLWVVRCLQFFI